MRPDAIDLHAAAARQAGWQRRPGRQRAAVRQAAALQARQRRLVCPSASYNTNPQNVEQCQVPPAPELTAEQAVTVQLEALRRNDQPWFNHGVQTAYEWALDVGGLDPSMYFGTGLDLYHFDGLGPHHIESIACSACRQHFMGKFANRLPELINHEGFEIVGAEERAGSDGAATYVVTVRVQAAKGQAAKGQQQQQQQQQQQHEEQQQQQDTGKTTFDFHLRRKTLGARKGSLMTYMVKRVTP